MRRSVTGLATAGVAVLMAMCSLCSAADEALPEALRGFSGQARGVVKAKGDKNTFTFKVGRVLRVWKGNKAKDPESLAGRSIRVGPRWEKGDGRKWRPVARHVAFIRQLKVGQEMTLEVRNMEGSHFTILELSADQRGSGDGEGGDPDAPKDETTEVRVRKLEDEVRRLKAEISELRRLLKERRK